MLEKFKNIVLRIWAFASAFVVLTILVYIFFFIAKDGFKAINLTFIFEKPKGFPPGAEGGIFPAIMGSLMLTFIACVFASVLAISTAIYVVFYCKNKFIKGLIHLIVQCMTGIPSIVLGLFGYTLLVLHLKIGRSLLAGSITLGIMIFPFIEMRIEKILLEVDRNILKSSYALGVSKSYTFFNLIVPMCKIDIISTITLAGGFAMGAAAPLTLTAAVISAPIPKSLFSPVMALPFHLYILIEEGISIENAFGTAFVLIILLLIINIFSIYMARLKE